MVPDVYVQISDETRREVSERPEDLDLDASLSEAERMAVLVEDGRRARRAQVRDRLRIEAYLAHDRDPEYPDALALAERWAREDGGRPA